MDPDKGIHVQEEEVWCHIPDRNPKTGEKTDPRKWGKKISANGRWNIPDHYEALYTSFTPRGALLNFKRWYDRNFPFETSSLSKYDYNYHRRVLSSFIVVSARPIIDFTDSRVRSRYNITLQDIKSSNQGEYWECQWTSSEVHKNKYNGIIAPNSPSLNHNSKDNEKDLVLYPDGISKYIEDHELTEKRFPINSDLMREHLIN